MPAHAIFSDDMQEIVESFLVETSELFEGLDNDILQLEHAPDQALVDQVFRSVHTVKGTAGFLDLEQLSELAHHFEDVLNKVRRGTLTVRPGTVDVLLAAFDQMRVLVQQVADRDLQPVDLAPVIARLDALHEGDAPGAEAEEDDEAMSAEEAEARAAQAEFEEDEEFMRALAEAQAQAAAEAVAAKAGNDGAAAPAEATPTEAAPEPVQPEAAPTNTSAPKASAKGGASKAPAARTGATETIRVPVDRLDSLMELVGELVLSRNRMLQLLSESGSGSGADESDGETLREVRGATAQLDFVTTELQTAVMRTRMVQIGRVFARFPRLVRDLAADCGKEVDLVLEGEETELDKSLTEEIADPLIHLVRNALDHGIETPDERRAAGKPARGRLTLAAEHEGDHILIVVEEDGAGIDVERVKAKAVEKGVVTEHEAAEMSDPEAFQLIFRPGFSTAQTVSQVSGRGVGMDVVKTNLARLNGSVTIESERGVGTRFTLKLPLTLAIIQSLLVRVGGETFGIPLHAVDEVVGLDAERRATIRGREVLRHRDEVVGLVRIGEALDVAGYARPEGPENAVVVDVAHQRVGLVVDALVGQKEIVIKPLGDFLGKPPSIAGSAILGDGRVVMVLDLGELVGRQDAPAAPAALPA
jgi:two-component system chemotaxis sensor kinase CheA